MNHIFSLNKKILSIGLSVLSIVGYAAFVFAAAPSGGYAPGATLDPACAPNDTDCSVTLPGGGSSGWGLTGNTISPGQFIGTTNAQDLVVKVNATEVMRLNADADGSGNKSIALFGGSATGESSFASGQFASASGLSSYAFNAATASGNTSFAITDGRATNTRAFAVHGRATGFESVAMGRNSFATGDGSITFGGFNATASGNSAVATGTNTQAIGDVSFVAGAGTAARSFAEVALGTYNTFYSPSSNSTISATDRLFILGNGSGDSTQADAFTILKNGKTGIGYNNFETTSSSALLQVNGDILSSALANGGIGCSALATDATGKMICTSAGGGGGSSGWSLTGDSGTDASVDFLGTTDSQDLVFKTNNAEAMRILANGNVGIGTNNPTTTFDVSGSAHMAQTLSDSYVGDLNLGAALGGSPYDGLIMGYHSPSYDRALTLGMVHDTMGDFVDGGLSLNDNNTGEKANFSIDEFGSSDNEGDDISVVMNNFNVNSGSKGLFFSEQLRPANNPTIPLEGFSFIASNFLAGDHVFNVSGGSIGGSLFDIKGDGTISFGAVTSCSSIQTDFNGTLSCGSGGTSLQWYAENASAPATAPQATGNASIALGDGAQANSDNMFVYGTNAGQGATNATFSNFFGTYAGYRADNASNSNFFGQGAGYAAIDAFESHFFGESAGSDATHADHSVFIGGSAGLSATNAWSSTFIGSTTGQGATNAANSIFIGQGAGFGDTVNNTTAYDGITTFADTSILIGASTSTGGYSNSIALGAYATNTSANQLMIGSGTRPIYEMDLVDGTNTCLINTTSGVKCTSDQRLKTNITDLSTTTLDTLSKVRTVTYNWISGPNRDRQIGFLAQDLMQYYPELVTTAPNGYYAVNYANMAPVLVEGIRELNLKLTDIQKVADATDKTFLNNLIAWFGTATNGIAKLFAGEVHTDKLCVGNTCVTESQLQQLIANQQQVQPQISAPSGGSSAGSSPSGDQSADQQVDVPQGDQSAGDVPSSDQIGSADQNPPAGDAPAAPAPSESVPE